LETPIVAHAYKKERDFLDHEFARAKVIEWAESAYADERYICTQVLFAQLFPGASKSLTSMSDRLVLDSSERDDRHSDEVAATLNSGDDLIAAKELFSFARARQRMIVERRNRESGLPRRSRETAEQTWQPEAQTAFVSANRT
jgi:hypothetical protein